MEGSWWGLRGKTSITSLLERSSVVAGTVGSRVDHHEVPYAMTEEFVAIYRMHPLLPEEIVVSVERHRRRDPRQGRGAVPRRRGAQGA